MYIKFVFQTMACLDIEPSVNRTHSLYDMIEEDIRKSNDCESTLVEEIF